MLTPTIRIRSRKFPNRADADGGAWYVDTSDTGKLAYIRETLRAMRTEEPGMDWALQACGTDATWHWWVE